MAILVEVQSSDVELIRAGDIRWRRRFGGGRRDFALHAWLWRVNENLAFFAVENAKRCVANFPGLSCLHRVQHKGLAGREVGIPFRRPETVFKRFESNDRGWNCVRDTDANTKPSRAKLQTDGGDEICVLNRADLLNRIPKLAPRFCFARLEEAEVRLIIRVHART